MKHISIRILAMLLLFAGIKGYSQDKSLYFLSNVPQAAAANPAFVPEYTHYLSIPVFSGTAISASSSTFSAIDFFAKEGSCYRFSNDNISNLLANLNTKNFARAETSISLIDLGFKHKKIYWSFGFSAKTFNNAYIPKSANRLRFGLLDPYSSLPSCISLTDIEANSVSYYETSVGAAYLASDNLKIGGRFKLLSGIAAINTKRMGVRLFPNEGLNTSTLSSSILINTSVNGVEYVLKDGKTIDKIRTNGSVITAPFAANLGMAIDLGLEVKSGNNLKIYASLVDFGFISWGNNRYNISNNSSYILDNTPFIPGPSGAINAGDALQILADTLKGDFTAQRTSSRFGTSLFTKVYIGSTYQLNEWLQGGLLLKGAIFKQVIDPSVTLSAIISPSRNFSGSVSWSYCHSTFNNIGITLVAGNKPIQFMVSMDNIPVSFMSVKGTDVPIPRSSRSVGIQLGLNIFWGEKTFKLPWRWKSFDRPRG